MPKDIEMRSLPLQQKALTSLAFHPESSAKYVHLAGLLARCAFATVFPLLVKNSDNQLLQKLSGFNRMQLTATGIAPDLHADFPFNRSRYKQRLQTK